MAAGNTQFKAENGLFVQGTANVAGDLKVDGNLLVTGNIVSSGTAAGDFIPLNNTYSLGNTTSRWSLLGVDGNFSGNLTVSTVTTLSDTASSNLIPTVNNAPLGSATRRWAITANTGDFLNITTTQAIATVNLTSNGTLSAGVLVANATHVVITNGTLSVNTGSKTSISATGNSTYSSLSLNNDVTSIGGNVAFDTDLVVIDAVNNRIGLKATTLSSSALATITGNVEFSTANTGIRLQTSNATHNASIVMVAANTSNSRLTFSTYDTSNSTVENGGFVFGGMVNSTSTQTLLSFSNASIKYKTGNVAHAGNFGIYDVNGTRLGP
jgi:cytoskeletal protein CcmA (bactofilin family)